MTTVELKEVKELYDKMKAERDELYKQLNIVRDMSVYEKRLIWQHAYHHARWQEACARVTKTPHFVGEYLETM